MISSIEETAPPYDEINEIKRFFATAYVKFIVPLIPRIIISGRPRQPLANDSANLSQPAETCRLLEMLETKFDLLEKKAFLAGGVLILFLRSRSS